MKKLLLILAAFLAQPALAQSIAVDKTTTTGNPAVVKVTNTSGNKSNADGVVILNADGTIFSGAVTVTGGATSAKQDTGNTSLSSIDTKMTTQAGYLDGVEALLAAATPAGELHIGEVGSNQNTVQVAQTVTASSAYTSGNAVGGLMTIANATRVSAGSGLLQSVVSNMKSAQTTQIDVFIFNANPTGSTCTDKTAFSVAAADFDKILGVASITTWFSAGTPSVGQAQNLAMPYALASGTTLYACAVTRSTPTYTATTDVSFGFRFLRN
jgi:hypothetical protein